MSFKRQSKSSNNTSITKFFKPTPQTSSPSRSINEETSNSLSIDERSSSQSQLSGFTQQELNATSSLSNSSREEALLKPESLPIEFKAQPRNNLDIALAVDRSLTDLEKRQFLYDYDKPESSYKFHAVRTTGDKKRLVIFMKK